MQTTSTGNATGPANATAQAQIEQTGGPAVPGNLRSSTATKPPILWAITGQFVYRASGIDDRHGRQASQVLDLCVPRRTETINRSSQEGYDQKLRRPQEA